MQQPLLAGYSILVVEGELFIVAACRLSCRVPEPRFTGRWASAKLCSMPATPVAKIMTDRPIKLDQHRGIAAQKATEIRRLLAEVEDNEKALRQRQEELETQLLAIPAASWSEAAEKARYLLGIFAATSIAQDPRRQKLIANVLEDFERLSRPKERGSTNRQRSPGVHRTPRLWRIRASPGGPQLSGCASRSGTNAPCWADPGNVRLGRRSDRDTISVVFLSGTDCCHQPFLSQTGPPRSVRCPQGY